MMLHLISDSGLHFWNTVVEFNPQEPLLFSDGRHLSYAICTKRDILTNEINSFDVAAYSRYTKKYYSVSDITKIGNLSLCCMQKPDGTIDYGKDGIPQILDTLPNMFASFTGKPDLLQMNNLCSLNCSIKNERKIAFEVLLGKWLPMPMFRLNNDGVTSGFPFAWCRVKIEDIGKGSNKGMRKYRLTWAFDTRTVEKKEETLDDMIFGDDTEKEDTKLLPLFYPGETEVKYGLCNVAQQMLSFLSVESDGFYHFSNYLSSMLGMADRSKGLDYILFYIYLVNYLRLLPNAAPEVTLYNSSANGDIPVDLVLDIGNSRTCGVLFEKGNFSRSLMLSLRDMTHPHVVHSKSFDMRFCFRLADVGLDISLDDDTIFSYGSFVRLGEEAQHLLFTSLEDAGVAQKLTNYSSPKRYLWDEKPYEGIWENLIIKDETSNFIQHSPNISVPGISCWFDEDGTYTGREDRYIMPGTPAHYSRSSLMTFVMIEIFQQAIMQINSYETRQHWGDFNMRRYLRNVIITCPTAMSHKEQLRLRQAAEDAIDVIRKTKKIPAVNIIPEVEKLKVTDRTEDIASRTWIYDEATACQLVYLYAEANRRYEGKTDMLFDKKGHVRPDMAEEGYTDKSLTIGTIDIGAGTTDVMVCTYKRNTTEQLRLAPQPLFYDSFYLAGDDILQSIIQNIIIEGKEYGDPRLGSIASALICRLMEMPEEKLKDIPSVSRFASYRIKVEEILLINSDDIETKRRKKRELAADMINGFFGSDIAAMDYKARRCRVDFNTQVSHPMSQFIMEQLRLRRPTKVFSFGEVFAEGAPATYLLDYFENHFGFRFEELSWQFDPDEVAKLIRSVMEGLMKQLSVILNAYQCDIIVLGGRPTGIDAVTDLFVKYVPVSPDRLVRMKEYHVGSWFPFADGNGFFYDQKPIVAVGAMIGYMASTVGYNGMSLDMASLIKGMDSTACYIGIYDSAQRRVEDAKLTPTNSAASFDVTIFPCVIGCKQMASPQYQARPLYVLHNNTGKTPLKIMLTRNYHEDRELLELTQVTCQGEPLPDDQIEMVQQSISEETSYWLDNGEFKLHIKN